MPAVTVTTQLGSVDANAGLQQNVTLTSPTTNYLSGTSTSSAPPGQTGPGWATIGSGTTASASGTASTSSTGTVPSWAIYALVAALAWFALKKLGG